MAEGRNPLDRACPRALAALETMDLADLRDAWMRQVGTSPPRVSTGLLRLALAFAMQAKALGGLSKTAARQLCGAGAAARPQMMTVRPGMRLVRVWQGTAHVVTIGENGQVRWNDRDWRSLSEVARAITGTRWSGPAFFGLKGRKAAA